MMKKILTWSVVVVLILCNLLGCSKKNNETRDDKKNNAKNTSKLRKKTQYKMEKDIIVAIDNCDVDIYNDGGGNYINFVIITKDKLNEKDLKVTFDADVEMGYDLSINTLNEEGNQDSVDVYMSDRTALNSNGIDWKKYTELEYKDEELEKYVKQFDNGSGEIIDAYFYEVFVAFKFDEMNKDSSIRKIYVEYKGEKIEKDVEVELLYNHNPLHDSNAYVDISESWLLEERLQPNTTGQLKSFSKELQANNDFVVKEIKSIANNSIEIESIDVSGSANNNVQQKWQGEVIVKKGQTVKFNISLKDNDFANKLVYSKNAVIAMIFEENGVEKRELIFIRFSSEPMLDELYINYEKGKDVLGYYRDYASINS